MPNLGYIVACPYYKSDKPMTITCEDTIRVYRSPGRKQEQIEKYCAGDWKSCQYAKNLDEVYRTGRDLNEYYAEARYREILKMISEAGKRRKETQRLLEEKKDLTAKLEASQKLSRRMQDAEKRIREKMDNAVKEINTLANLYEQIFAYLLTGSMAESLELDAVDEWAKQNEYRMIPEYGEDEKIVRWKCEVRARGVEGSSGEPENSGGKEAERARSESEEAE